jgi:hypothetical protein
MPRPRGVGAGRACIHGSAEARTWGDGGELDGGGQEGSRWPRVLPGAPVLHRCKFLAPVAARSGGAVLPRVPIHEDPPLQRLGSALAVFSDVLAGNKAMATPTQKLAVDIHVLLCPSYIILYKLWTYINTLYTASNFFWTCTI